jgi:hypothetical protein
VASAHVSGVNRGPLSPSLPSPRFTEKFQRGGGDKGGREVAGSGEGRRGGAERVAGGRPSLPAALFIHGDPQDRALSWWQAPS